MPYRVTYKRANILYDMWPESCYIDIASMISQITKQRTDKIISCYIPWHDGNMSSFPNIFMGLNIRCQLSITPDSCLSLDPL